MNFAPKPFHVDYISEFLNIFKFHSPQEVEDMPICIFLKEYLGPKGLKSNFILTERNYVSRDFMLDHSEFYCKCFGESYGRKCVRYHLFGYYGKDKFSDLFEKKILNPTESRSFFEKYYHGSIVIKPIPSSLVGYSLLKTYEKDSEDQDGKRVFWTLKSNNIHLFGSKFKIKALPFIQQDSVLAACASIAIWTVYQKASASPFIKQKSPGEITKDAGIVNYDGGRIIPNVGLDISSMCTSIAKNDLEPIVIHNRALKIIEELNNGEHLPGPTIKKYKDLREKYNIEFSNSIKKLVHAYSNLGIPLILGMNITLKNGVIGGHAVAIAGHFESNVPNNSLWRSDRVTKLYVHDERWGPYSRMEFLTNGQLLTPWDKFYNKGGDNTDGLVLIIPVFSKVRVGYEEIFINTTWIKAIIEGIFKEFKWNIFLQWEIKIMHSYKFKSIIKKSNLYDVNDPNEKADLLHFLSKSMPKYVWVSTAFSGDKRVIDIVFDATDFKDGVLIEDIFVYYRNFKPVLTEYITKHFDELLNITIKNNKFSFPYRILNQIKHILSS